MLAPLDPLTISPGPSRADVLASPLGADGTRGGGCSGLTPTSVVPPPPLGLRSLVLDLEVEVSAEPVDEERGLHVAGGCQLPGAGGARVRGLAQSTNPMAAPSVPPFFPAGDPTPTPRMGPTPAAHLRAGPIPVLLMANLPGDMVHLCDPHEPVALQDPVRGGSRHCPTSC